MIAERQLRIKKISEIEMNIFTDNPRFFKHFKQKDNINI